jgi:uncharacterized cupin superfamily protein
MTTIFKATRRQFEPNPGRAEGFCLASDASIMAGMAAMRAEAGSRLGAGSLNFDMRRLDPGELSSLYHFHRHAEELFMIVSGSATLRTPNGFQTLSAGDIAFFESGAGGAHQLYNHGNEPCVYLDVRTFAGADIAEYPDSGRMLIVPTMEIFPREASVGYFEGAPAAATIREFFRNK